MPPSSSFPGLVARLLAVAMLAATPSARAASEPAAPLPRPLTLEGAISYALEHSPALRAAREKIAEQEGVLLEADARRLPGVNVGASYAYTEPRLFEGLPGFDFIPLPDPNSWQVAVSIRQLVYSGGGVAARRAGAAQRLAAARAKLTGAINQAILGVQEDFFDVLLAREEINVHEEAMQVLEKEAEQAKVRRRAGTGSDFDVLRAEVALANARPALVRARNAWRAGQDALRAALGAAAGPDAGPDTDLDVQGELVRPPLNLSLPDAIRTAREHRPELLAGEELIAASREDIAAAKAGRKPQVSLVGDYALRKASYQQSFGRTLNGLTVGAQLDWSIFDGRATQARVRQAAARAAQAEAGREELALEVELEVRNAHRAVAEAADLLTSAQKNVDQAAESLRLARVRLDAGTANQLEVLAAQSALTDARSNLSQAQHDYAVSEARLLHATGTASATD
ncbi:MAG TPA: TolC family protein [Lacunisphaera sp.]|nr:TolC family protein [Lacunisphaera sp.]